MSKRVTPKQKKFCDEYLVDLNATQAAIRAGYSEKTAYSIGQENLNKPEIQESIERLMSARMERVQVRQDDAIKELATIAFSKITDFLSIKEKEVITGYEKDKEGNYNYTKPIKQKMKVVDVLETAKLDQQKVAAIAEIKQSKDGSISIKMCDKLKALELLGRHLGMFKDNVNISGNVNIRKLEDYF